MNNINNKIHKENKTLLNSHNSERNKTVHNYIDQYSDVPVELIVLVERYAA